MANANYVEENEMMDENEMLDKNEVIDEVDDDDEEATVTLSHEAKAFMSYTDDILNDQQLRLTTLGTRLSALFTNEDFIDQCSVFAEYASDNVDLDAMLSPIDWEVTTLSFGELIDASQYQSQHGLSSAAITQLFLDKTTGLTANAFCYYYPVEAVATGDGYVLIGGHTRLMSKALMLRCGGCEWNDILDCEINVLLGTINIERLAEAFNVDEKEAEQRLVPKIEATLWLASNRSRKPTSDETASFSNNKQGISLRNPSSILDSNVLSTKDKCINLMLSTCYLQGYIPDHRTGAVQRQFVMDSNYPSNDPRRYWAKPPSNAVRDICRSTLTALSKIAIEEGSKTKKWTATINSPRKFLKLIDALFEQDSSGLTFMDRAIIKGLELAPPQYAGNIARNASLIGQQLALMIDDEFEPPVTVKKEKKATTSTSKASKFKTRRLS